ncbi:hypothetical protein [Alkaliphilus serpentinus]|uniref:hypothetical protein n=1 Tax=Alkaliphilus serpentinus TaxID=1482731 RepID=UPI0018657FF2|nr:hypothetical protein [Alkaliphilus serpentinus]
MLKKYQLPMLICLLLGIIIPTIEAHTLISTPIKYHETDIKGYGGGRKSRNNRYRLLYRQ